MSNSLSTTVAKKVQAARTPTALEVAWMAGIYEGEGNAWGSGGAVRAHVTQKDPEILYRIREIFGGSIAKLQELKGRKRICHIWKLHGDASRLMFQAIFPYLSTRRKMQVENAGGLVLTGAPCMIDRVIDPERKLARSKMTKEEKQRDSKARYIGSNLEKIKAYEKKRYAASRQRKEEAKFLVQ